MGRVGAKYKARRAKNVCVCQWCRLPFQATRYDAKTCSARCRKALSRFKSDQDNVTLGASETGQVTLNMRGYSEVVTVQRDIFSAGLVGRKVVSK